MKKDSKKANDSLKKNKKKLAKCCKKAADNGNVDAMNSYADMLKNGEGIERNTEKAIRYYKMAADNGNVNAMNSYADMLSKHYPGVTFNMEEAIKYYKMAIEKGDTNAMCSYAWNIYNKNKEEAIRYYKMAADLGDFMATEEIYNKILDKDINVDNEEKVKYYKMAIDNEDIDFFLDKIPDKQVFTQLFRENNKKIIDILNKCDNEFEYHLCMNDNKIKSIEINDINCNDYDEKEYQVIRKINFDENGNLINITDTAIHKGTGKKLYEVEHNEEEKRLITYFDPENGTELITATIDENGIIKFNFDNGIDLKILKQKTNEILNSFSKNKSFDYVLY